jgi:hypothetical protein
MRAREFINEQKDDGVLNNVINALPATYTIPVLKNQDPYLQYRFGVALAGAKGAAQRHKDGVPPMRKDSDFGEDMVIVSYDPNVSEYIDDALKQLGYSTSDKKMIGTPTSDEEPNTNITSPVASFKGYKTKRTNDNG